MNHLTNFYKNKCENLQEKLCILTRMLNEADAPLPTQGTPSVVPPSGIDPRMFDPSIQPPVERLHPREYHQTWPPHPYMISPGSLWYDREGRTWEMRNGRWILINNGDTMTEPPVGSTYNSDEIIKIFHKTFP